MTAMLPTLEQWLLSRRSMLSASGAALLSLFRSPQKVFAATKKSDADWDLSDQEWKKRLSPESYQVLRREGTEPPFTSALNNEKRSGTYHCAGCDLSLFSSQAKYDSGTGWPSF